jgi:hypothetical protein
MLHEHVVVVVVIEDQVVGNDCGQVRNDEFATTLVITNEQFARYTVGEIVEVEVTVWERNNNGEISYTYKLIG